MSSATLKTRARNLQKALQELLNQPVKLSQAYELIAQEEGFVNWDTASPVLKKRELAAAPITNCVSRTLVTHHHHPDGFSLDRILAEQPSIGAVLESVTNKLSLTVITGLTGSGKSSFAGAMLLRDIKGHARPIDISAQAEAGGFEKAIQMAFRCSPDVIFVGELRTLAHVVQAVNAVRSGHRVIATMHGAKGRTLYESLCSAIPQIWEWDIAEGFRTYAGWDHHHIHVEYKRNSTLTEVAPLEVGIQGATTPA